MIPRHGELLHVRDDNASWWFRTLDDRTAELFAVGSVDQLVDDVERADIPESVSKLLRAYGWTIALPDIGTKES